MTIDWWTMGLQTVNVIVLVWILHRYLFRPVTRIIAERQAAIRADLDQADAARKEAETAREAARRQTDEIAARRSALLAEAAGDAAKEKQRLIDQATAAADRARAAGQEDLDRLKAQQAADLQKQAGALAADIAARLLDRLPASARIAGFTDGLADALGDLPEATRKEIGATGPVGLRAARALSAEERAAVKRRLDEVLGRDIALEVTVDPSLLAGLELDAPHAIIRNHFRADLDRIRAELTHHD